jgi:hypothetical protein
LVGYLSVRSFFRSGFWNVCAGTWNSFDIHADFDRFHGISVHGPNDCDSMGWHNYDRRKTIAWQ